MPTKSKFQYERRNWMSSTTNSVGQMVAYMTQSAAAVSISSVTSVKYGATKTANNFDSFLNKASNTVSQNDVKTVNTDTVKNQKAPITDKKAYKFVDEKAPEKNSDDGLNKFEDNPNPIDGKAKEPDVIHDEQDKVIENEPIETEPVNPQIITQPEEIFINDGNMLQTAIVETGKEFVSKIAEALDIDEEDILNAMQVLGLSFGDLLNQQNIQLIVETAGGTDKALDLITDSDLYAKMQDLFEGAEGMRSELLNEFELSENDFQSIVKTIANDFSKVIETNAVETDISVTNDTEEIVADAKEPEVIVNNTKAPEVVVSETGDNKAKEIKAPLSKENTPEIQDDEQSNEIETTEFKPVEETTETAKENRKGNESGLNESGQNTNPFNQLLNNISDAVNVESMGNTSYTDRAQMENIIRQITEKITISTGTTESSMELQLHPAHLGHVNILLTSTKEGIIAKFTAQNQIVKEAVESQMVQLQEKFEQQGIKVTAVEVTIASHAFEQNLQQGDENSKFNEQQAKSKKSLRRINLSEFADIEDEEELSESDLLAAKVMEMNGNTVDYSA
jgi:flagellar hook-length control protein FliK